MIIIKNLTLKNKKEESKKVIKMVEKIKSDLYIKAKKCKMSDSITKNELENMSIKDVIDYISCTEIECDNCKICIIENNEFKCIKRLLRAALRENFKGDNHYD